MTPSGPRMVLNIALWPGDLATLLIMQSFRSWNVQSPSWKGHKADLQGWSDIVGFSLVRACYAQQTGKFAHLLGRGPIWCLVTLCSSGKKHV